MGQLHDTFQQHHKATVDNVLFPGHAALHITYTTPVE